MKITQLKIVTDNSIKNLQASKWLQLRLLLGEKEIFSFFEEFKECSFFRLGNILPYHQLQVQKKELIQSYLDYIEQLKNGNLPEISFFAKKFTLAMTKDCHALFAYKISEDEYLLKMSAPIIQIQVHSMHYSEHDHQLRPMTFGKDCITWGLQFAYPQMYLHPETSEICKTDKDNKSLNSELFKKIIRWQRGTTIPTPFVINGELINSPIKIGKSCLSWINNHPQLCEAKIKVKVS